MKNDAEDGGDDRARVATDGAPIVDGATVALADDPEASDVFADGLSPASVCEDCVEGCNESGNNSGGDSETRGAVSSCERQRRCGGRQYQTVN